MLFYTILLREILHAGDKELLILFARDVLGDIGADPLAVRHLAEYTPVGGGDTLDRRNRGVGVKADIVGRISV